MEQEKIYDSLFKEVGRNQLTLSLDEQYDLLQKFHNSDFNEIYSEKILKANLKLIMGICRQFLRNKSPQHPLYMDIHAKAFREGLECLKRFRFDKGNCTVPSWIRNNVYRALYNFIKVNSSAVKCNAVMLSKMDLYRNAKDAFFTHHERQPVEGDEIDFLYRGKRIEYKFTKDYQSPIVIGEDIVIQAKDEPSIGSIFEAMSSDEDDTSFFDDNYYVKEIFQDIIQQLPFRQRQIMELVYYRGHKIKNIERKMTPLTRTELLKAEKNQANVLKFKINGKAKTLKVFVAEYEIIDVQNRDANYSFLLNDKYYTNSSILKFNITENIDIEYNGNIYKGVKKGDKYLYEIKLEKKMNPTIVRMTIDQEHNQAKFFLKKYILKNKLLEDIKF